MNGESPFRIDPPRPIFSPDTEVTVWKLGLGLAGLCFFAGKILVLGLVLVGLALIVAIFCL